MPMTVQWNRIRILCMTLLLGLTGCSGGAEQGDDGSTDDRGPEGDDVMGDDVIGDDGNPVEDVAEEDLPIEDAADEDGWVLPDLAWTTCSLFEGEDDDRAQCARMEVPWRWGVDEGRAFTVFAKRIPATRGPSETQIWLLEGGPGGAGSYGYPSYMEFLHLSFPFYDVYTIDARGTGTSQFLSCPADESGMREVTFESPIEEVAHCIGALAEEYGDDLDVFGATQSARDLAAFIDATRPEGRKIILWGNSAGTHWAFRFLQLFPDKVHGVVLEAVLTPDFFGGFQDESLESSVRSVLGMCADDAFCSTKLPDPAGALGALLDALESGHCPDAGLSAVRFKGFLGFLAYYRPFIEAIPAVIYRLARCDEGDVAALEALRSYSLGATADRGFSIAVFFNEYFSEMWDHPTYSDSDAYLAYLDALYEDALIAWGEGYFMNGIHQIWPVYDDPLDDRWPGTDVPMLLLQGHLDPATYLSQAQGAADHFTGPNQRFLDFPYAAHGVIFNTPMGHSPLAPDCGVGLLTDFLQDPEGELDTSCMDLVVSFDFEGTNYAMRLMGAPDYWEN